MEIAIVNDRVAFFFGGSLIDDVSFELVFALRFDVFSVVYVDIINVVQKLDRSGKIFLQIYFCSAFTVFRALKAGCPN